MDIDSIREFVEDVIEKDERFLLFDFGFLVNTNLDDGERLLIENDIEIILEF